MTVQCKVKHFILKRKHIYLSGLKRSCSFTRNIVLVRADVGRLPFRTGSIDGVHAGAALHCWPSPSAAVAEISRVLKPGGVFVASTFLSPNLPFSRAFQRKIRQALHRLGILPVQLHLEPELRELLTKCGFVEYTQRTNRLSIWIAASKPR